jgi:nicotinamidase-related amidase
MMKEKVTRLKEILSDQEREIVKRGKWGKQRGLGGRPCLLVIDAQHNYVGSNAPILEQMDQWPSGCGAKAWEAVPKIKTLLETARRKGFIVIYTRQVQKDLSIRQRFDSFGTKIERAHQDYVDGAKGTEIIEALAPQDDDLVIDKSYASAFFATPLISFLVKLQIDSILFMGGTTSGCIRSTVVDAAARNYNVGVVMDCVFDRIEVSHRAALLDIWMKYGDILTFEEALGYLKKTEPF